MPTRGKRKPAPATAGGEQEEFEFEISIEDDEEEGDETPDTDEDDGVEIEDDTPPEDKGRTPLPEDIVKDLEADSFEKYDAATKERMKQLKKVWHDERREKERMQRENNEAVALARKYHAETQRLRGILTEGEKALIATNMSNVEKDVETAKREYREAYESGDGDKMFEASEKLSEATYRRNQLKGYNSTSQDAGNEVEATAQEFTNSAPKPDAKTLAWQERNEWFGTDEEMTAAALGLHQKLVKQRGAEFASSDEYWSIVDQTMRKRFSDYFGEPEPKKKAKPSSVVAPATRSTGPKRVVLSSTQAALAKKFGLTPQQYAAEMVKLEQGI